jgi:hypothetical protein
MPFSSEGGSEGDLHQAQGVNALSLSDDPRTLSEIKRSRIDLDRRYVFLCATSLSKHFEVLPHQAKDGALLVFKCSREWLVRDPKDIRKAQTQARVESGVPRNVKNRKPTGNTPRAALSAAACHSEFSKEFMQWVLTKEKEGCIFWWKPEKDFKKLSKFLEEKIDPVSEQPYRPLLLEPHWWRVNFHRQTARYCNNPSIITSNIMSSPGLDKRDVPLHVLQELIYQSNPTLEPIAKWPYAPSMRFLPKAPSTNRDFVGHYASFKGYINHGTSPRSPASRAEEQSRMSGWPPVARERLDDLKAAWHLDDVLGRRTLPEISGAPATILEGGGLFGSRSGFGQGYILKMAKRLNTADSSDGGRAVLGTPRSSQLAPMSMTW